MNASEITTNRQRCHVGVPLASTLLTTTQTIRSTIGGPATTVTRTTSTLYMATCGLSLSYETLAAAKPVNPVAPPAPVSTLIRAYREVYSTMTSPSTTLMSSTYASLAPTTLPIC